MSVAKTPKSAKAPLEGFHPKQHTINVVMTDGTKFQILTNWGKEGQNLTLDADPKNQAFVNSNNERINKFKNKFDFNF